MTEVKGAIGGKRGRSSDSLQIQEEESDKENKGNVR